MKIVICDFLHYAEEVLYEVKKKTKGYYAEYLVE